MTILITGGTGSFGQTMLNHLLSFTDSEIRIFSRDEAKQDDMRNQIHNDRVKYFIGDIRDRNSLENAMKGVEKVFHAAALKQVPSCEFFPLEAVRTNILGSENVLRVGIEKGVKSLVFLSTDKAVSPINAMGLSKALMEKLVQSAARDIGVDARSTLSCVRYGNVMYSRGSVIPLFIRQIKEGIPLTITEPKMTRFLMPLRDSVALVNYAFENAEQGDIFINKAPSSTIKNLCLAITELFDVPNHPVHVIGWRHSEKLFETLATAQELSNSVDHGQYLRISMDSRELNYQPYFTQGTENITGFKDYTSHNVNLLSIEDIKNLLLSLDEIKTELKMWKLMDVDNK